MPDGAGTPPAIEDTLRKEFLLASQFEITRAKRLHAPREKLTHAWSRVTGRLGDLAFERGIETAGHVHEVPHFHPDRVWYQASGWSYLTRILRCREIGPADVFLDMGSGKGRVLLQAAQRYRFARVIGVEISEELNRTAAENIARRSDRLRSDVELVTADAAAYEMPDDVTVVYFYYPFVGDTFRRVMDNMVASLERRPRRLRLIYAMPTMEEEILRTGVFRPVRTVRIVNLGVPHRIVMYEADGLKSVS